MQAPDTPKRYRKDRLDPALRRIVTVIVLSSIMSIIDTTIVNVALQSLSRQLHSPLSTVQWVVSAYLLALAAVIPLSGWAVRRHGAYRVYVTALILFTAGSALCGLATSAPELIVFRAVQGLGGGLLAPTSMTILVHAAGRDGLSRVMSAMGTPTVLAPVFGPTLGGILLQTVGWHAIFLINVPIGVATAFAAVRLLPRDRPDPAEVRRLDWIGLIVAAGGTVAVTYGLSQSASAGSITSSSVLGPVLAGCALLVVFVLRSRRMPQSLLDLNLYRIRAFSSATVVMFCLGGALFGAMILFPLYFQIDRGQDAIRTGLLLIPQSVGAAIGMNQTARLMHRLGAGLTSFIGVSIVAVMSVPFVFIGSGTSFVLIGVAMALRGTGVGLAMMPAMTSAFATLDRDQVHDASPQLTVIQRIGGSVGTAVVAVVLQGKLSHDPKGAGPAAAAAIARSFGQTYEWVIAMSLLALLPASLLWRMERRSPQFGVDPVADSNATALEPLT